MMISITFFRNFLLFISTVSISAEIYSKPEEGNQQMDGTTILNEEDFINGMLINKNKNAKSARILPQQRYYKGDLHGKAAWLSRRRQGIRRNGVISVFKKWPNARIPYVISTQYNKEERAIIARAFDEYHLRTCIRFAPRTLYDQDYLYIGKIDGCYSDVGRAGGRQEVSLDEGCLEYDTAIHELMHSVGFYHEHERWDRDNHITILWSNIDRDAYDQFGKTDFTKSSPYGQPYDYFSILHYDGFAFSKNGLETLVAKRPDMTRVMGKANDFSVIDIEKINRMYSCYQQPNNLQPQPLQPVKPWLVPRPFPQQPYLPPIQEIVDEVCEDQSSACHNWLDLCHSPIHEAEMRKICAKSCWFCASPVIDEIRPFSPINSPPTHYFLDRRNFWFSKINPRSFYLQL